MFDFKIHMLVDTQNIDPFLHLAREWYLLENSKLNDVWLYFWKSEDSVILGKNQVPWVEINIPYCKKHNIKVARRISGGGTVFHDLGNLNYSFIIPREIYSEKSFLQLIIDALTQLRIPAEIKKKNSLFFKNRKIGGTAFRLTKNHVLHHGTLLLNADLNKISKALKSDAECVSKAIKSQPAPVLNLKNIFPSLLDEDLIQQIQKQFVDFFKKKGFVSIHQSKVPESSFKRYYDKISSWQWIIGETPKSFLYLGVDETNKNKKYEFLIVNGKIKDIRQFSQLADNNCSMLQEKFGGIPVEKAHLKKVFPSLVSNEEKEIYYKLMEQVL